MRITFTKDVVYETDGPGRGALYAAGETFDLRDDLAQRWLRRGVAVVATEPPPTKAEPAKAAPAPQNHGKPAKS